VLHNLSPGHPGSPGRPGNTKARPPSTGRAGRLVVPSTLERAGAEYPPINAAATAWHTDSVSGNGYSRLVRTCDIQGCERPHEAKGYCHAHYTSYKRTGVPPTRPVLDTDQARFWAKVTKSPDCWLWIGATASEGRYGAATLAGHVQPAHRVAYQLEVGEIPAGLDLDHLCRNTLCVRPDHLEPVTHRENVLRGDSPSAINAVRIVCQRGHTITGQQPSGRLCLECRRENNRERTRRYRERLRATPAGAD